ncbi:long-chain-fatty-acid--CoA ligase 1-like isoform X4 [Mytilus galloprovincialis]
MDYLKLAGAGAITLSAVSTATYLYLTQNPNPVPSAVDLNNQTIIIKGKDKARISKLCKDGKLLEYLDENVQTLYEAFRNGAQVSSNGACYGWKPSSKEPYKWISYNDVLNRAANIGAGLIANDQAAINSTRIGLYSQNRVEYGIVEQACYTYSMALVPLYDTLGPEACTYIVNQANISLVICDTCKKVQSMFDKYEETPNLKTIVMMEELSLDLQTKAQQLGIKLLSFSDLEEQGEKSPQEPKPAKPDDICVVCYTSGTTGLPKGAMLTHKGTISTVCSAFVTLENGGVTLGPEDVLISYLPLAHSYERLLEVTVTMSGGRIGFFQGDVKLLMDDIKELSPTLFPSVPRLLNRFYDKVVAGVNESAVKKMMFDMGMKSKQKELQKNVIRNDSIYDKLVFKKIQQGLGGKVRLITTGSAPLSATVLEFLRCCVGCPIIEGYGQTESHALCSMQFIGDASSGNVGPPIPSNLIKLDDVPDMNYFADQNKGEVCLQGPSVFVGYLNDEVKTKEVLDKDGWLHTGDIGEWLPNGTLKIIDRKKHIFKLAQGEYIAPEKIENIYVRSTLVAQIFVHGDSLKASLVAVCVPDPEVLPSYAKSNFNITGSMEELVKNPEIKKAILADLTKLGKSGGLHSFEQVRDIYVHPELFSVENGLLTPTFKAKRQDLKKVFQPQIDEMYTKLQ